MNCRKSLLLLTLFASPAFAAPLAYEGFDSTKFTLGPNPNSADYPTDNIVGQGATSGSGFTGAWVQDPTLNSRSNLYWADDGGTSTANNYARADGAQATYPGLGTTAGNLTYSNALGGATQVSLQRNFTTGTTAPGELFASVLLTIDGSSAISLGFQSSGADSRPFQFGFTQGGNLFARGSAPANVDALVTSGTAYGPGTYFIVARFNDVGTTNDSISLWVNPSVSGLGSTDLFLNGSTTMTSTNFYVGGNGSYQIQGLVLDFKSNASALAGSTRVDEIRIGTTYANVIPEPSLALLLFPSALLLALRRRRELTGVDQNTAKRT